MDAQELRSLQEAYREVYDNELGEGYKKFPYKKVEDKIHKKESDNPTGRGTPQSVKMDTVFRHFKGEVRRTEKREHSPKISKAKESENRTRRTQKEQTDIYDIILSHLLDEGYAETPEAAEAIMVNMSEEWREDIVEGYKELPVGKMRKQVIKHAASGTKRAFLSKFRGQKGTTAGNVEDAKAMKSLNKAKKIQGEIEKREKMGSDFYQGSREGRAISNRNRGR
jgi:hypothetical protein